MVHLRYFGKNHSLLLTGQTGVEWYQLELASFPAKDRMAQQLVVKGGDLLHAGQKDQDGPLGLGRTVHYVDQDALNQVVVDLVEVHFGEGLRGAVRAEAGVTLQDLLGGYVLIFLASLGSLHL